MVSLGVNVAIFRDDTILLTKRRDFEVWCMPGGAVEPGESVAQAAVRETSEETGLQVKLTRLVGIYSRPGWKGRDYHICLFVGQISGGSLRVQPEEVLEARYFAVSDLPDNLLIGQRHRIADAASGVGGSVAKSEDTIWPFDPDVSRADVYALCDASGLSRAEFYAQHYHPLQPDQIKSEVGEV